MGAHIIIYIPNIITQKMLKWALKIRLLQLRVCVVAILCLIAVIQLFSVYGLTNYPHLPAEVIETQLYKHITPKLLLHKTKPDCKYDKILQDKHSVEPWEIVMNGDRFDAKGVENGSYVPEHCNPMFSVAILVTYRNRQRQLDEFLPYMHNFLRKQNIHYKIYLIEQQDEKPWNKGILYNIGAKQAITDKFPCLILHDVDLLPLDSSNLYVCTNDPRHMSAVIDKFRYVLPYTYLVGGVLAIKSDQYVAVNGFANIYERWGGEDDDFFLRLKAHKLNIIRFPPKMSRYTMMSHPQEPINPFRYNVTDPNKDGLISTHYLSLQLKNHKLFTLIGVKLL